MPSWEIFGFLGDWNFFGCMMLSGLEIARGQPQGCRERGCSKLGEDELLSSVERGFIPLEALLDYLMYSNCVRQGAP